tara:strand:- start:197 stop:361 length:165 start_codon:yes stop_codon:yes gene_type:complete
MTTIECPFCDYSPEALIDDDGKVDKNYIPEHYCYPLDNDCTTAYTKINNKWEIE